MHFKRRLTQKVRIEMTPMIDAVFLLLIFFMVTSSIINDPGIKVKLPQAKSSESQPDKDLMVTIRNNGDIYLNDRKISERNLYRELRRLNADKKRDYLVIRGDEVIYYKKIIKVMDIARQAGFADVTLATRR